MSLGHDPLVILDTLRASIRIQLAFKEDYEMELKSSIDAKNDLREQRILQLEDMNSNLKDKLKRAEIKAQEEESRTRIAERDQMDAIEAAKRNQTKAEDKVKELIEVVKRLERANEQLKTRLTNMDKSSMEKDAELVRVAELEGKLLSLKGNHTKELHMVQKLSALKVQELEKEVGFGHLYARKLKET